MRLMLKALALLLTIVCYADGRSAKFSKNDVVRQLTYDCTEGGFKCASSGRCIRSQWLCDGDNDCGDKSDEPETCPPRCPGFSDWLKCSKHDSCFHKSWLCDGVQQCGDGTDEPSICPPFICNENSFKCRTQNRCIPNDGVCDGVDNCEDKSDESEDCQTRSCPEGTLKCNSGQCISKNGYCFQNAHCRDGTRFSVDDCPPFVCGDGMRKCPFLDKCIRSNYFCDGDNDCGDGSDEGAECSRGDNDDGSGEYNEQAVLPCPPDFVRPTAFGSCYKLLLTPMNWLNASKHCAALHLGAHLAFISNGHEQRTIFNLLTDYRETEWWIGGERIEFGWNWKIHSPEGDVTNTPMSYTNWAPSEPNNAGAAESCIAFMQMAWWNGRWNDDVCTKEKRFICEV